MTHNTIRHLAVLALLVVVLIVPTKVSGQSAIPTFNPPVVNVELSGVEPEFSSVAPIVTFSQGGGDCSESNIRLGLCEGYPPVPTNTQQPHWESPFDNTFPFGLSRFWACGYNDQSKPTASVILPSGNTQNLKIDQVTDSGYAFESQGSLVTPDVRGCYTTQIEHKLGMEIGGYKIVFDSPSGRLEHDFRIDYPKSRLIIRSFSAEDYTGRGDYIVDYLEGFSPNTSLTVRFYGWDDNSAVHYVATRTVTVDNNGSVILKHVTTRSTPNWIKTSLTIIVDGTDPVLSGDILSVKPRTSQGDVVPVNCDGFLVTSRLKIGDKAQVLGPDPNFLNSKPSRPSLDSTSHKLTLIPVGDVFQVTDGPSCAQNILWWKVNYKGTIGWTGEGEASTYWVEPVS